MRFKESLHLGGEVTASVSLMTLLLQVVMASVHQPARGDFRILILDTCKQQ